MYAMDLTITNATLSDRGIYTCHAKDMMHKSANSIYVNVYGDNSTNLTLIVVYIELAVLQIKTNISSNCLRKTTI